MLRALDRPAVSYDLLALASLGLVTVGRENDSALRLDCPEIPFLLSRKHATLQLQPDGTILLSDLHSTNGTYVSRAGDGLTKLEAGTHWDLREGDRISFGGPETILAGTSTIPNPFIFKFYHMYDLTMMDTSRDMLVRHCARHSFFVSDDFKENCLSTAE